MFIGVDIGGTNIKCGVVDSSGSILMSNSFKTETGMGPSWNLRQIKNYIFDMIGYYPSVQSIGIGVPGIIDKSGLLHVSPNLPEWHGLNIHDDLKKDFNLFIVVDNDANAAAVAELEIGSGINYNDFIYVTLGTGIGGAIIINKTIFRGTHGGAGEIGHTIINYDLINEKIQSYRQGTLEELAGRKKIISNYELRTTKDALIKSSNVEEVDVFYIAKAAQEGEKEAIECLREKGEIIGIGLASAMNLLDIPVAIIGGGISQSGDILFDAIRKTIKQRSLPTISERFDVKEAHFKSDTGIIGAAMLAANKLKENKR